ncbi:MAG: hypothetical protein NT030_08415, partial [Candidatus Saganbacteria bacterium]|nr:hypothetical protein [Candidatus Saganbacteria bacterium]
MYGSMFRYMARPMPYCRIKLPDDLDSVTFHQGENADSYEWVTTQINFLMEMMKLFPGFEQYTYEGDLGGEYQAALKEFGDATTGEFGS